jgi:hypothetical protein
MATAGTPVEILVGDHRAGRTLAQMVERKLLFLLTGNRLPTSLGQMKSLLHLRPQRRSARSAADGLCVILQHTSQKR